MGYNLNFYLRPREKDKQPMQFYSIRQTNDIAEDICEELDGSIPFLMDSSDEYYDITNEDFNRIRESLEESIKTSNDLASKWRDEAIDRNNVISKSVSNIILSGGKVSDAIDLLNRYNEDRNIESSINGQLEYAKELEDKKHRIEMLQMINNYTKGLCGDFSGICFNIT